MGKEPAMKIKPLQLFLALVLVDRAMRSSPHPKLEPTPMNPGDATLELELAEETSRTVSRICTRSLAKVS
jgi:hypothetical protein